MLKLFCMNCSSPYRFFNIVSIPRVCCVMIWGIGGRMFLRYFSTKPKPKMKPIELSMPLEQTETIARVIFNIVKEHGPLTFAETWERVKEVGLGGLTGKSHMKIVLRCMR
ncbi:hypothetical protein Patl1_07389 [Pistacia atlantica]|uniref:Uncharacterized protein n=1 Tax=Pistacia atlantica TaxID=434234 RepID=A0ACC1AFK2_9ROSI|nr:hypothetical protein Patl1_07389 [Pistacia atlantica]